MRRIAALLLLTACSSNKAGTNGPVDAQDAPAGSIDAPQTTNPDAPAGAAKPTIYTILLENHDYAEIIGSANAPYVNGLLAQAQLMTNYKDSGSHPSLPNYLYMISGATQYPGVVDVNPTTGPYFPADQPNLGTQLQAGSVKWRSYQESMGTACKLTGAGTYAPKHDPFLYFVDQQTGANGLCAKTNVDYSMFAADMASNAYRYMWVTPNLNSDGHDPTGTPVTGLKNSDAWLKIEVPKILASDGYKAGGILFITWDEAEGRNNNDPDQVPMIILSPRLKKPGMTTAIAYSHASYLATVEDLLGLPRLATVTAAPSMIDLFTP